MTRRDLTPAETLRRVHDIKRAGLALPIRTASMHDTVLVIAATLDRVLLMLDDLADDLTYGITDSTEATDND